jgi:uncharacterized protein
VSRVFVDTSGFYAVLNRDDPFHDQALTVWRLAERDGWTFLTSNYVVQESWALIQNRLGWEAVEGWQRALLARCTVIWVDEDTHRLGAARCRQAAERRLSLTDCVSFEIMLREGIREYLGDDEHFQAAGFRPASSCDT